eukprot:3193579-Heterocapsa_arctica.AAC.1
MDSEFSSGMDSEFSSGMDSLESCFSIHSWVAIVLCACWPSSDCSGDMPKDTTGSGSLGMSSS